MSEQVLLAIIACVGSIATISGTCFGAYMTWKVAQLKDEQDKNAKASRERFNVLNDTCQATAVETAAQTDLLNEIAPEGKRVKSVRPGDSQRVERDR